MPFRDIFNAAISACSNSGIRKRHVIQVATREQTMSGGHTALSIILQKVEDGVSVQVGQQAWLGIAASLGTTALSVLRNPWSILNRLDDIAQDIENLQMSDEVWKILESTSLSLGATQEFSERLQDGSSVTTATRPIRSARRTASRVARLWVQRNLPHVGNVVLSYTGKRRDVRTVTRHYRRCPSG